MRDEKGRDQGVELGISGRVIFKADLKETGRGTLDWIRWAWMEDSGRLL
jgi:hypothetical protein